MANQADILKAYLVSIGFQINEADYKKFRDKEEDTDKKIQQIKKTFKEMGEVAVLSVSALAAGIIETASKLEKLYYASQRTGSSASNLQAFQFATDKIGISAEEATASVEGIANVLRTTPGVRAIFQGLGVDAEQDKVKVLLDLVDRLRRMPFYMGSRLGERLGISPQTLFLMEKNFDQLKQFYAENQKLTSGTDEEARAAREFANNLRDVEHRLEVLAQKVAVEFMPAFNKLLSGVEHIVDFLIRADKATHGWSSAIIGLGTAVGGTIGSLTVMRSLMGFLLGTGGAGAAAGATSTVATGAAAGGGASLAAAIAVPAAVGAALGLEAKALIDAKTIRNNAESSMTYTRLGIINDRILRGQDKSFSEHNKKLRAYWEEHGLVPKAGGTTGPETTDSRLDKLQPTIDKYSKQYGVNPLLMRELIRQESEGKQTAKSKVGALGLTQLMPDTARLLGVNPLDAEQNIAGGTHHLANLLKRYKGNETLALAAYNAGEGRVDKYHGVPPASFAHGQTRDYVDRIMSRYLLDIAGYRATGPGHASQGATIRQRTTIHVTGAGDPVKTGEEVYKNQGRVNGDLVRLANGQPT